MANDNWIKVEDALPEKYEDQSFSLECLVWDGVNMWLAFWSYTDNKWEDEFGNFEGGKVTHWMALPEPPSSTLNVLH